MRLPRFTRSSAAPGSSLIGGVGRRGRGVPIGGGAVAGLLVAERGSGRLGVSENGVAVGVLARSTPVGVAGRGADVGVAVREIAGPAVAVDVREIAGPTVPVDVRGMDGAAVAVAVRDTVGGAVRVDVRDTVGGAVKVDVRDTVGGVVVVVRATTGAAGGIVGAVKRCGDDGEPVRGGCTVTDLARSGCGDDGDPVCGAPMGGCIVLVGRCRDGLRSISSSALPSLGGNSRSFDARAPPNDGGGVVGDTARNGPLSLGEPTGGAVVEPRSRIIWTAGLACSDGCPSARLPMRVGPASACSLNDASRCWVCT